MTRTPAEARFCAVSSARRAMSAILHAMASADTPASLAVLTDAYAAASLRLEQAQSIALKG